MQELMLERLLNSVSSSGNVLEISERERPTGEPPIDFSEELSPTSEFESLKMIIITVGVYTVTYVIPAGGSTVNRSAPVGRRTGLTLS